MVKLPMILKFIMYTIYRVKNRINLMWAILINCFKIYLKLFEFPTEKYSYPVDYFFEDFTVTSKFLNMKNIPSC